MCVYLKILFILFLERGEGREKEREISVCGCLSHAPTGDLAHNPGMCPDWELKPVTLWSIARAQSTELHQQGYIFFCNAKRIFIIFLVTPEHHHENQSLNCDKR